MAEAIDRLPRPRRRPLHLGTRIALSINLAVVFVSLVIFFWIYALQQRQVLGLVEAEAQSLLNSMVLMRKWVADYGGVWTEEPGESYFEERNGFYLKTPAMVTKEISQLSEKEGRFRYHITSDKLKNEANAPMPSEHAMLAAFVMGRGEFGRVEMVDGERVYHYMVPLHIEKSCLKCHEDQGYELGDLRGGLSVFLPMDRVDRALAQNRLTLGFSAAVVILLLVSLYLLVRSLIVAPIEELKAVTTAVGKGNYRVRSHIKTGDELESLGNAINQMVVRLKTSHDELEAKVRQRTQELDVLSRIVLSLSRDQPLSEILEQALDDVFEVTSADSGAIHLYSPDTDVLELVARRGLPAAMENCAGRTDQKQCVPRQVTHNGQIIRCNSVTDAAPCTQRCPLHGFTGDLISAPLRAKERIMGVVTLITHQPQGFSEDTVQLLECIGHQLGVGIENAEFRSRSWRMATLEERARLARELHDNLGQTIGYLNLNTRIIADMVKNGQYDEALNALDDMRLSTRSAYDDVRWAILDLRAPGGEEQQDFGAALHEYLDEFEVQTGLECEVVTMDGKSLSPDVAIQLIRIVQEAMHNVRKHAQARCIWVKLETNGAMTRLSIEDDGVGIDNCPPDPKTRHFGLRSMRERAESIGWRLEVGPRNGGGTQVVVSC